MKPVIALVGRPNVGKSTLFNRLTRTRDALVADYPGLTRDRKYGTGKMGEREYLVVDTGGISGDFEGIDEYMAQQTWAAVDEADILLFMVDGKEGLTASDELIVDRLRRIGKPVQLVVNKVDGRDADQAAAEFYSLGFSEVRMIAAAHGRGVASMISSILDDMPELGEQDELDIDDEHQGIRIAFVGRPNVGKSTLINRILGEDRVVAFDKPGTTRDSIYVPFERDGQHYTLIDTAGVRRRAKVNEAVEKFSVIKTYEAIDKAHVVIMVLDAHESISDQDAHLLGLILDAGRALVIAINKWDGLDEDQKDLIHQQLELKLPFLDFAEKHFISALHGTGVGHLYKSVHDAHKSSMMKVSTSRMTKMLETAVLTHQPPLVRGRRIKLRYAHQGGSNPFTVIIHGNQTTKIPGAYKRYLMNYFRETLKLKGTQVKVEFKTGDNPFEGKRIKLTPRQQYSQDKAKKSGRKKKK